MIAVALTSMSKELSWALFSPLASVVPRVSMVLQGRYCTWWVGRGLGWHYGGDLVVGHSQLHKSLKWSINNMNFNG